MPSAIEYSAGELRVKGVPLPASALNDANQRLRPLGYRAHTDGDALILRQETTL